MGEGVGVSRFSKPGLMGLALAAPRANEISAFSEEVTPFLSERVLVVDDNTSIHDDFRKILSGLDEPQPGELASLESDLFGAPEGALPRQGLVSVDSAFSGDEGLTMIRAARAAGAPYGLCFMDIRLPLGIDGVEAAQQALAADDHLQIVLCTAYSDYGWEGLTQRLGLTDRVVLLKKPFDAVEVRQLAESMQQKRALWLLDKTEKARLARQAADSQSAARQANELLRDEIGRREVLETALRSARTAHAFNALRAGTLAALGSKLGALERGLIRAVDQVKSGASVDTHTLQCLHRQAEELAPTARALQAESGGAQSGLRRGDVAEILAQALSIAGCLDAKVAAFERVLQPVPPVDLNPAQMCRALVQLLIYAATHATSARIRTLAEAGCVTVLIELVSCVVPAPVRDALVCGSVLAGDSSSAEGELGLVYETIVAIHHGGVRCAVSADRTTSVRLELPPRDDEST